MNDLNSISQSSVKSRKENQLEIKLCLLREGIAEEAIAQATLMEVGSVRNLLNGSSVSLKGRQRITNHVGKVLWEGITPSPLPPDLQLIANTLAKAEEIHEAETDEALLAAKLSALVNDELIAAIHREANRVTLHQMAQFSILLPRADYDRLFRLQRDPKNPNRIRLGGAR